jgi:hypothetical protein
VTWAIACTHDPETGAKVFEAADRDTLQAESHGHAHSHNSKHAAASDLLHSCLLFDGLATAQAAVSNPPTGCALPLLAQLGIQSSAVAAPRNTLFAQRVRVRDPPSFS